MTITKEELEKRRGACLGFFYLREREETCLCSRVVQLRSHAERKCHVFAKGCAIRVWDGAKWRPYSDFEPSPNVALAYKQYTGEAR